MVDKEYTRVDVGMSLRDYLAAHSGILVYEAVQSLIDDGLITVSRAEIYRRLCKLRLAYADIMLEERKK